MDNKNDIVNPLEHLPKLNCFKAPQGYFERLQQDIELHVALQSMPFEEQLSAIKNKTAFSLPENYFDSLAARIAGQTVAETTLEALPKGEGFIVPQGYFNALYLRIAERVSAGAVASRPWWQPAPALRPVLAFAGIAAIAVAVAWPFFTGTKTGSGLALVTTNEKIIVPQANNSTTHTIVADIAITKQTPAQKQAKQNTDTINEEDLLGLTGADYSDELTLSEVPLSNSNNTDNGIVEILAEEDIDLTEIVGGGM